MLVTSKGSMHQQFACRKANQGQQQRSHNMTLQASEQTELGASAEYDDKYC
jgi:hypothetical protein